MDFSRGGGNHMAAGRPAAFGDTDAIIKWLTESVTTAECFHYTTDRSVKAACKDVLLSEKYQQLFRTGIFSPPHLFNPAFPPRVHCAIAVGAMANFPSQTPL